MDDESGLDIITRYWIKGMIDESKTRVIDNGDGTYTYEWHLKEPEDIEQPQHAETDNGQTTP